MSLQREDDFLYHEDFLNDSDYTLNTERCMEETLKYAETEQKNFRIISEKAKIIPKDHPRKDQNLCIVYSVY